MILYDRIPGGTGYLKQLLSDKDAMIEVFEKAAKIITACTCEKDGCYRCVFAYRISRYMKSISKKRALSLLSAILSRKDKIIEIDNLQDVTSNKYFESELEKLFIEILRESQSPSGNNIKLEKRGIRGKECYLLFVDGYRYEIEPQVSLGRLQNVMVENEADFIIRQLEPYPDDRKPVMIAVYTDGFAYHADPGKGMRIDDDFHKRMAVSRSGNYITWSLSWEDVIESTKNNSTNDHFKVTRFVKDTFTGLCEKYDVRELMQAVELNAFKALIHFLAHPHIEKWALLAASAAVSLSSFKNITKPIADKVRNQFDLPEYFNESIPEGSSQNIITTYARYGENDNPAIEMVCFIPGKEALRNREIRRITVVTRLYDNRALDGKIRTEAFQVFWNTFISLYNIFQFLPDTRFVTSCGIKRNLYAGFFEAPLVNELDEILSLVIDSRVKELVEKIYKQGLLLPEVGFEITGNHEQVIGEAELAWPDKKVCLLLEDMKEMALVFKKQEWNVFIPGESSDEELLRSIDKENPQS